MVQTKVQNLLKWDEMDLLYKVTLDLKLILRKLAIAF